MEQDDIVIKPTDIVTVTKMNHLTEIQYLEKMNFETHIRKLSKETYVDLITGEVKEFKLNENRSENKNSLQRTFKKLRYLINNNFVGLKDELFITLTYAENMTDHKKLGKDFNQFSKRLKRRYPNLEYIRVSEPQERGAWHLHVLLKNVSFISNKELSEVWGHGFVRVNKISDIDNIGAYLTAYLINIPVEEYTGKENLPVEEVLVDNESKKIVKGGRLHLYPSGMNFFAKSKGMKYPKRERMKYGKIKKDQLGRLVYVKNKLIESDDFNNSLRIEHYNQKRNTREL